MDNIKEIYNTIKQKGNKLYLPWMNNYQLFYNYIISNLGDCPDDHTLGRTIKTGGYVPFNVEWIKSKDEIEEYKATNYNDILAVINKKIIDSTPIRITHIAKSIGYCRARTSTFINVDYPNLKELIIEHNLKLRKLKKR